MRRKKEDRVKKIRITLDLTPQSYERLEELENLVDAGTKANVIRQALQLYEYVAQRALEGCTVRVVDQAGAGETIVVPGVIPRRIRSKRTGTRPSLTPVVTSGSI